MKELFQAAGEALISLLGMIPMWGVKALVVMLFAGLVVLALRLPRDYIFTGAPDKNRWRDVRIWIVVVVILEVLVYLFF
jgi:hypothetical protein